MFAASKTDSASDGGYQISRSLRFNSADSAYLNRTPASAGNRRTFTVSLWMKQSVVSAVNDFFGTTTAFLRIRSDADGKQLQFYDPSVGPLNSNNVLRDPSAWYHFVMAVDTTQATASNRVILYINGVNSTNTSGSYPSQNYDYSINNASEQLVGKGSNYADGYITEVNFIDGQALTPSSFGETDTQTGVWKPKAYSGSYGTNGFYLNFSDNSNTTAATLGKDYSGNGNNWTPNNFSVTAGVGNDSLVDSPTSYGTDTGVGGTVRGNYCTLNPLFIPKSGGVIATISNGNLDANTNNSKVAFGTIEIPSTGKWYFEYTCNTFNYPSYGIGTSSALGGGYADAMFGFYQQGSNLQFNIGNNSATGTSSGIVSQAGDIALICVDMDNGKIWMGRDRSGTVTWSGGGTPAVSSPTWSAAGQGGVWSTNFDTTSGWFPLVSSGGTDTWSCNFGQRPFAYTAPSGFKALCTQNLPTPTIGATTATQAGKYFNTVLYTGTGSSLGVTGVGFQPDWVWVKDRSGATDHGIYDAVRGVQKQLESNTTTAETTETTGITAFGSDGFTTGALAQLNTSAATYVAWNWKANGSGSSNTAGSITSTVSANTTSGFSVVTYTGTGANATVGHGLGVAPSMFIVKRRSATSDWPVYHTSIGATKGLYLNNTFDAYTSSFLWNNTAPTSTVFTVGTDSSGSGVTHVAYCFAEVSGYSKFGSYTGNGSADGPFVYTGFRPAYVLIKAISGTGTGNWVIQDISRNTFNVSNNNLYANLNNSEDTSFSIDFLSNGFKLRSGLYDATNQSGANYAYMCFAQNPFKTSLAR